MFVLTGKIHPDSPFPCFFTPLWAQVTLAPPPPTPTATAAAVLPRHAPLQYATDSPLLYLPTSHFPNPVSPYLSLSLPHPNITPIAEYYVLPCTSHLHIITPVSHLVLHHSRTRLSYSHFPWQPFTSSAVPTSLLHIPSHQHLTRNSRSPPSHPRPTNQPPSPSRLGFILLTTNYRTVPAVYGSLYIHCWVL